MLEVVNDGSYSVQDRNVAKQQMVAMQNHIFEYEDMLKAMKPESQQNNSANINSADAIVGINQWQHWVKPTMQGLKVMQIGLWTFGKMGVMKMTLSLKP